MKLRTKFIGLLIAAFSITSVAQQATAQVRARVTIGNTYQPYQRPVYRQYHYVRPYYGYRHDNGLHRGWYKNGHMDSRYHRNMNDRFDRRWDNRYDHHDRFDR